MFKKFSIVLLFSIGFLQADVSDIDLQDLLSAKEDYVHLSYKNKKFSESLSSVKKLCGNKTPKECQKLLESINQGHKSAPVSHVMKTIKNSLEALDRKPFENQKIANEIENVKADINEYREELEADNLWVTQSEVDKALRKKSDESMQQLLNAEIPEGKITRVPTPVVDGSALGDLTFQGYFDSAYNEAAAVKALVDGTPATGIVPGCLVLSTTDSTGTSNEHMKILADGKIGINTSTPNAKLNIEGAVSAGADSVVHIGLSATALKSFVTSVAQSLQVDGNLYVGNNLVVEGGFTPIGDITLVNNSDTPDSECLIFEKSRGDDVTPTIVQDDDYLGMVCFKGYDGNEYLQGSAISSEVNGVPSDDVIPAALSFRTSPTGVTDPFVTALPIRMQISANGEVGIPTAVTGKDFSVSTTLVVDSSANEVGIGATNVTGKSFAVGTTKLVVDGAASEIGIGANNVSGKTLAVDTTKLVVDGSANEVGIGAANVSGKSLAVETTKLVVDGSANEVGIGGNNVAGITLNVGGANATTAAFSHTTPASTLVNVGDTTTPLPSGTTQLAVQGDVFAAAYKTSSDTRIKKNVEIIDPEESLSVIQKLTPKTFDFTSESQEAFKIAPGRNRGLMAQEVQAVIPGVVSIAPNEVKVGEKTIKDLHLLSYMGLIPDIIGAVKANDNHVKIHRDTLDKLVNRVEELEARLARVEKRNK